MARSARPTWSRFDTRPPFRPCAKPRLAAEDPLLRKHIIGYRLSYGDIWGIPQVAGEVTADDIGSAKLIVHSAWNAAHKTVTLRLAYVIAVRRGRLPWTFVVDTDTGAVIAVNQRFST
jgi:hypothetical protein